MTLPFFSMRVRLDAMARVKLNMLDSGRGWRSLRAHALACHVCYNRRNARYFRFRESSGWRYWSYNPTDFCMACGCTYVSCRCRD